MQKNVLRYISTLQDNTTADAGESMSIQLIARELYKILRKVDDLEKDLAAATDDRKAAIADNLRKLRAEYNRMRAVLDGHIDKDF